MTKQSRKNSNLFQDCFVRTDVLPRNDVESLSRLLRGFQPLAMTIKVSMRLPRALRMAPVGISQKFAIVNTVANFAQLSYVAIERLRLKMTM